MLTRRQRSAALAISTVAAFACSDQPTAPVRDSIPSLAARPFATELLSPQWQSRTRTLVSANSLNPFAQTRVYAAVSVAQYRAVVAVGAPPSTSGNGSDRGFGAGGRSLYEAQRGAVAGASVEVLSFLFPSAESALEEQVTADANAGVGQDHPDFARGLAVGRAIGEAMIAQLQSDGSTRSWDGTIPVGLGFWTSAPGSPPGGANLGGVTPYLVTSTSQFRSAPPPAWGSVEFQADLNEVLTIAQNRTAQQTASAVFWNTLGPGGTMGYWNNIAATYIDEADLSELDAVRVFALMHAAQRDAMLTCFESKYVYFVIRPSQAEPLISLAIGLPNYPAYPSGHACISSSAAHVLKHFFDDHTDELTALVEEAGESRILAGIHYRFDITASWVLGEAVANWAISHEQDLL